MRNKTKVLDLYMYVFDFISSYFSIALSFISHHLGWTVVEKRTELTVESFEFWLWFHHIMAMIILAKFEWPKGRGLILFI